MDQHPHPLEGKYEPRLGGLSTQHFATKEDWDDPANPPQEDEVK